MKKSDSITVEFKGTSPSPADGMDVSIALWHDEHPANTNADEGGGYKSEFGYDEVASLVVSADFSKDYTVESVIGTLQFVGSQTLETEEFLAFLYESEKNLGKIPKSITSMEWDMIKSPEEPPAMMSDGTTMFCPEKCFGVLKVSYSYDVHLWYLTVSAQQAEQKESVSVPVLLMQSDKADAEEVPYKTTTDADAEPYDFLVIDDCTEDPIPGATFLFQGKSLITGEDGRVFAGVLEPGTYKVGNIKAPDHLDSNADTLQNEEFTI